MATPAFIYAFDNLGPDRFVELVSLLLGARYRGFRLGGPGADGGIDSETVPDFGELLPEAKTAVLEQVVDPGKLTVFQFKHKVVARTGQSAARSRLLAKFRATNSNPGELSASLIAERKPDNYVLVTNVEINSQFRQSFREICREANPDIQNFEVIGLDDLQAWVIQDRFLRSQFFPTLFGRPRFNLSLKIQLGKVFPDVGFCFPTTIQVGEGHGEEVVFIDVLNTGEAVSYLDRIRFKSIVGDEVSYAMPPPLPEGVDPLMNPKFGAPIEPGQRQQFRYYLDLLRSIKTGDHEVTLVDLMVWDQIENLYTCEIPNSIQLAVFGEDG